MGISRKGKEIDRKKDWQKGRQIDIALDSQIDRQIDRQIDGQLDLLLIGSKDSANDQQMFDKAAKLLAPSQLECT